MRYLKKIFPILLFCLILSGVGVIATILGVRYYYGNIDIALMIQYAHLVQAVDLSYYGWAILFGIIGTILISLCIMRWKKVGIPLLIGILLWFFVPEIEKKNPYESPIFSKKNYVLPKVIPPKKTKNIIWISLESAEKLWTYPDVTGGENVMPKLAELQNEGMVIHGWLSGVGMFPTLPSYIATDCGVPRQTKLNKKTFQKEQGAVPYAVCMSDILRKYGYDTTFVMGARLSDEAADLFTQAHPFTTVMSRQDFLNQKLVTSQQVITGTKAHTPDTILLDYAKEKITQTVKQKKPFFISVITANTHGPDFTYIETECERKYNDIRDSMKCMDQKVVEFVRWVQQQPFYKDTVIFLIGDHPTWRLALKHMKWLDMKTVEKHDPPETYNVVLDGSSNEVRVINKPFTQVDWAPTMLESAGFTLKPRQLGLGVSLWSNEPSLLEKYGSAKKLEEALKNSTDAHYHFLYEGKH